MSVSRSVISGGVSSLGNEVWCVFFLCLLLIDYCCCDWVVCLTSLLECCPWNTIFLVAMLAIWVTLSLCLSLNRTEQNTYINGVALRQANYRGLGGTIGRCVITLWVSTSRILLPTLSEYM